MEVVKIHEPDRRSEICDSILRKLPRWFGIESAIVDFVNDVRSMETWAVFHEEAAIGFVSINKHFSHSAEVHVMGVLESFHRQGIGHQLLNAAEADLKRQDFRYLSVKTLSESRPDKDYDHTRNFYLKFGFTPLEEFKTLWDEYNPCLLLVKHLSH